MLEFPLFQKGMFDLDKSKSVHMLEGSKIIYTETDKRYSGVISHDGAPGNTPVAAQK
jgi:hypothetical protein